MLNLPEIESHLNELRQQLQAQGAALKDLADNMEELRGQLQVGRPPSDARPDQPCRQPSTGFVGQGQLARSY